PVPKVKDTSWVRNAIDAFVLAKVEAAGLRPAPPADRVALARRLYYDLTGLPPTPEEIDAFAADHSADAYERLVDRLLASPAYGGLGRWADEPADKAQARYDALDGIVSTTGQVVLGMTVGCARCHDHKRDPIPQRDYYRLLAFVQDVTDMNQKNTRRVVTAQ